MRRIALLAPLLAAALSAQTYNVTPTVLNFGNAAQNTTSILTFAVSAPAVLVGQPPIDYAVTVSVAGGAVFAVLDPQFGFSSGGSKNVRIAFTPTQAGSFNDTATVTVMENGKPAPSTAVSLSGSSGQVNPPPGPGGGTLAIDPPALDFGTVLAGCSRTLTFTVTASVLSNFTFEATNPSLFTVNPPSAAGQLSTIVSVTLRPSAGGSIQGAAVNIIASSGPGQETRGFVILGAVAVDLSLSTAALNFGSVQAGGSATQRIQLGATPATATVFQVSSSSSNSAFSVSPITIPPGTGQVTFSPPAAGAFNGTIGFTITDPVAQSCALTRNLSVTGAGFALDLTITPASIDFGRVPVGGTSPPASAVLRNNSTIDFSGKVSTNNAAFAVDQSSFSVGAGKNLGFNFTFKPASSGVQNGVFTFNLTSPAAAVAPVQLTLTVNVTGNGSLCDLIVTPSRLDFGDVEVGSSTTRLVTATNGGGVDCQVLGSTGLPFGVLPASFTLSPGASLSIEARFAPAAAGPAQGTLALATGSISRRVDLAGRGVVTPPALTFTAPPDNTPVSQGGAVTIAATSVGSSNSRQIQIANTGSTTATINNIRFLGAALSNDALQPALAGFQILSPPALPMSLNPGSNLSLTVNFRPDVPGRARTTLLIEGPSLNATLNLTGVGLVSGARITNAVATPGQQLGVGLRVDQASVIELHGRLTLGFTANAVGAPDEPAIQFATGGRTADFTVPANATDAVFGGSSLASFQTGTVAGTISLAATLFDPAGTDVTPAIAPSAGVPIPRSAPVIRSISIANRTAGGFQLVIVGFATSREVAQLNGAFTGASGVALQARGLPLDVSSAFTNWYTSAGAAPFGSLFTLTVQVTADGDLSNAKTGSFTLANPDGTSGASQVTISP